MFLLLLSARAADIPTGETWDLSAVYPSVQAWEAAVDATEAGLGKLAACRGHVAEQLKPCLDTRFALLKDATRVHTYASNLSNADTRDAAWLGRAQQAELLLTHLDEAGAFFRPEILALGAPKVEAALKADPALAPYDYFLPSARPIGSTRCSWTPSFPGPPSRSRTAPPRGSTPQRTRSTARARSGPTGSSRSTATSAH
jgi:hypothetical protein